LVPSGDRKTEWRQGSVIAIETAMALKLIAPSEADTKIAIVISHDCDLVQSIEVEPDVEVIAGDRIPKSDGNSTHAKNPRTLVITLKQSGVDVHCRLSAQGKAKVSKCDLMTASPDKATEMPADAKATLQKWLASRYRRTALPDEFDRRLKATGLQKRLASLLEPAGNTIIALFFLAGDDEKPPDQVYDLAIYILYYSGEDSNAAKVIAAGIAKEVAAAFNEKCKSGAVWANFELVECEPVSDEAMTVAMERKLKKWNADFLSLRADPQSATRD
jgi:hypothetical protein